MFRAERTGNEYGRMPEAFHSMTVSAGDDSEARTSLLQIIDHQSIHTYMHQ